SPPVSRVACTTNAGHLFLRTPLACGKRVSTMSPRVMFMRLSRSGRAGPPTPLSSDPAPLRPTDCRHKLPRRGVRTRQIAIPRIRGRSPGPAQLALVEGPALFVAEFDHGYLLCGHLTNGAPLRAKSSSCEQAALHEAKGYSIGSKKPSRSAS